MCREEVEISGSREPANQMLDGLSAMTASNPYVIQTKHKVCLPDMFVSSNWVNI
ncbi:conserved hypothetical protein [Ricinus communis]|uniref:Uncharacterized protein n=1 Tax=Ricinus communis TaxID=3988 RepID=B9T728_RICCO|nr:conserved hypothetical protein [Ricinus communis]